jgi:glycosyltransferase involved in cell wall biosynthesis
MRVAMVGEYPLEATQIRGGVQAVFAYLVKGLARIKDLQVHVLLFRKRDWTGPEQLEQNGVTVHWLPPFPPLQRLENYSTYQAMLNDRLAHIRPHVVHAQDSTAHAYVAVRSSYPAVFTAHGVRVEDGKYYGSLGRRLRNYFDSWVVERYIMGHTRYLIVTAQYVVNFFKPLFRPDIQIFHISNAVDDSYFSVINCSDGHTILYAGRIIPRKHVHDLVQAFAKIAPQFPAAQLRMVGEYRSEPAYAESVRDLIRNANLQDRAHILGTMPDIAPEFAACDILALPSAEETSPMVIAQAMAAGKPVIATRVGGVPEMVRDGETGFLVNVGDVDGMAHVLLRLLQDAPLRARMGQAGHASALDNHQIDSVAQRTFDVYKRIVGMEQTRHA